MWFWVLLDIDIVVLCLVQLVVIVVMFWQMNVVWVIFVVCVGILDMFSFLMNLSIDVWKELMDILFIDRIFWIFVMDLEDLKGVCRR